MDWPIWQIPSRGMGLLTSFDEIFMVKYSLVSVAEVQSTIVSDFPNV